jgi:peptidoglycan hydrolase CwlO-like protein
MKIYYIILGYIVVIVCTYLITTSIDNVSVNEINTLHNQNDSLYKCLNTSNDKLSKLDSISDTLQQEIQKTKKELSELQVKSKKLKQKYDTENLRISNLSNAAVVSEFTNAFN